MKLLKKGELKSVKSTIEKVEEHSRIILTSTKKNEITTALQNLICISKTDCLDDFHPDWTKGIDADDVPPSFNLSRCFIPPRFMQLMKQRFYGTKRWEYVKPYYTELYNALYEDIQPETGFVHSSGNTEDVKCMYTLSPKLVSESIDIYKQLIAERMKKMQYKKQKL